MFEVFFISKFGLVFFTGFHFKIIDILLDILLDFYWILMDEFGDTDPLLEHSDGDDDDERSDPKLFPWRSAVEPVSPCVS